MTVAEFFTNLENGSTWSAGVAFKRSNPLPIDRYSVFKTEADALSYVKTNAVAYPGQIVATVSDKEAVVYVIASVGASGKLVKLAASSTASDISDLLAALTERVAALEASIGNDDISSIFPTDPVTPEEEQTITKALLILKEAIDANAANIAKNKAHIDKKVDSVTAADKSVTVTSTTTKDDEGYNVNAVTVKAARSAKTGNRLTLETDGLYVPPVPEQTDYSVTVGVAATTTDGMLKTYEVKQLNNVVGTIDIPKDFLVKSGSVKSVTEANKPYTGAKVGDKYIELIINSKDSTDGTGDTALYIPVKDLVDVYTGDDGSITKVKVTVGSDNVIKAELLDSAVTAGKLATDAVTTVKIKDANVTTDKLATDAVTTDKIKNAEVTKAKLEAGVQTSLGKADSALQQADIKTGTANGNINVKGTDVKVKGINNAAYKDVATTVTATAETLPTSKAVAAYVTDAVDSALYVSRWTE